MSKKTFIINAILEPANAYLEEEYLAILFVNPEVSLYSYLIAFNMVLAFLQLTRQKAPKEITTLLIVTYSR